MLRPATLLLLAGVLTASVLWQPPTGPDAPVLCPFRALTHLPCPGCGLTRSFCALGHGDWAATWTFHPLGPPLYVALIVALAVGVWRRVRGVRPRAITPAAAPRAKPGWAVIALALVAAVWAVRLAVLIADGALVLAWYGSPLARLVMRLACGLGVTDF